MVNHFGTGSASVTSGIKVNLGALSCELKGTTTGIPLTGVPYRKEESVPLARAPTIGSGASRRHVLSLTSDVF